MKTPILITILVTLLSFTPVSQAGHKMKGHGHHSLYDRARVVDVETITQRVRVSTPQRDCWEEKVHYPRQQISHQGSAGSMILGGIIGGVIGNHFGKGKGKDAATLAGTLIGSSIGHANSIKTQYSSGSGHVGYETRCHVTNNYHHEERTVGYWVSYRYKDEIFRTRMKHEPDEWIKLRIHVTPLTGY